MSLAALTVGLAGLSLRPSTLVKVLHTQATTYSEKTTLMNTAKSTTESAL